jgi:DNA polymerase-3 subunit epsilon
MYRPATPKLGLPWGVVPCTRAEYTAALLRFRKAEAERKRLAEVEKEARKLMDKKLNGIRGLSAAPALVPVRAAPAPQLVPSASLFDDFTVLDLEFQGNMLLELAAIRYQNWQPVGQVVSYVRFTDWVWPKITEVTGITTEHVKRAPKEADVLKAFYQLAGSSLLICHNLAADRRVLEAARLRQGATQPLPNHWFDTLALARARLPKSTSCGLGQLCERFGFSRHGAHQALRDVEMCFQVLRHFHQEDPILSLDPKARKAAPTLFAA